jgi:hypothetical protein
VLFLQLGDLQAQPVVLVGVLLQRGLVLLCLGVQEADDLAVEPSLLVLLGGHRHAVGQRVFEVFELLHEEVADVLGAVEPRSDVFLFGLHLGEVILQQG